MVKEKIPSWDEIKAMMAENTRGFAELRESQKEQAKENAKGFAELRESQKELRESQKKTDEQMKETEELLAETLKGIRELEVNSAMFYALADLEYLYECGLEEGYEKHVDGQNFLWPYTTDNGVRNSWTQLNIGERVFMDTI